MSTALTSRVKKNITREVDLLLGRGWRANPFPLDQDGMYHFWHNTQPKDLVMAYEALAKAGMRTNSLTESSAELTTEIDGTPYRVILRHDKDCLLQRADRYGSFTISESDLRRCFPAPWDCFREWCVNQANLSKQFNQAMDTMGRLLEFCSTAGQLTRAVPELKARLPKQLAEELNEQSRASNMPFEWARFDRDLVTNLQFCITKAYLLPDNRTQWTDWMGTKVEFASVVT
jgi:hypothetical protein